MSGRAAGSSASTVIVLADRDVADVPGQVEDRQRAAPAAASRTLTARRRRARRGPRPPPRAARPGTRRPRPSVVAACSETRTLPEVSAPIATSTCDGSSVEDVHDEPDETAKPRRSSALSSASPSTYRQENVTMCGSRSTGSPSTSTSGTCRDRRRGSGRSARGAARRPSSRVGRAPPAATRPRRRSRGRSGTPGHPAALALVGRVGRAPPDAGAHGEHASRRAAPRARVAGEHRPAGRHRRVPERLGRVDDQRHGRARPPARSTGWVVPTSWLAACSAAAATPGCAAAATKASASTRPCRSTPIGTAVPPSRVPLRRVQHRRVLDRAVHERRPLRGAGQRAEHRGVQRLRAVGGEADLVRPGAERFGQRLAGRVEQQPGPPARAVEPGRVGPAVVQRGEQRLRAPPGAAAPRTAASR